MSIFECCMDRDIQPFTTVPVPYKYEHAEFYVDSIVRGGFHARNTLALCIEYGKRFSGVVSLQNFDSRHHLAKIGYWVAKEMRGKGVAVRAASLICAYGMHQMGLRRIEGLTLPGNEGSAKVLLKAGFKFEAVLKSRVTRQNGDQSDARLYALVHSSHSEA